MKKSVKEAMSCSAGMIFGLWLLIDYLVRISDEHESEGIVWFYLKEYPARTSCGILFTYIVCFVWFYKSK